MNRQVRDEPSIGSVDMSDIEFRRRRPRSQPEDAHPYAGLWWRIALGIFVGLLAHSIVTGLYVRWEIYKGLQAIGVEFDKFEKEIKDTLAAPPPARPATPRRPHQRTLRPLATGERCVGGKRFREVPNGWVQLDERCR